MKRKNRGWLLTASIGALAPVLVTLGADKYVDDNAPANGDGSQGAPWQTVQMAVSNSTSGDVILVAQGTYYPASQNSPIALQSGVRIEGGYYGWDGTQFDTNRNIIAYQTVFSGNLGGGTYAYRVVEAPDGCQPFPNPNDVKLRTNLDGVTIRDGHATGTITSGGGVYVVSPSGAIITSPVLRKCKIHSNVAQHWGGGILVADNAEIVLRQCEIYDNHSDGEGGGLALYGRAILLDCSVHNNTAYEDGGGIKLPLGTSGAELIVVSSTIENNAAGVSSAFGSGGGISGKGAGGATIKLINSKLVGNTAPDVGGAIEIASNFLYFEMTNCTVSGNSAGGQGGGLYFSTNGSTPSFVKNSIFWDNAAPNYPEIRDTSSTFLPVYFSNVEGGWTGAGSDNIGDQSTDNPNFVGNGDYHLKCQSPCIDTASAAFVPCDQYNVNENSLDCQSSPVESTPDLDLQPRIVGGSPAAPDMGCYEIALPTIACESADFNDDGCINVQDLLAVINAWGPCQFYPCLRDIAPAPSSACGSFGDSVVNVADMLAVINSWGGCPSCNSPPPPPPEDVYDCMEICANESDFGGCLQKCMCGLGYDTCD